MPIPDDTIESFIAGLQDGKGKRGLWCHGPRKSGTTRSIRQLVDDNMDVFPGNKVKKTAAWVESNIKQQWKLDALLRANGTDFALWRDAANIEEALDILWSAESIWIDDLYPELEESFVRKNILTRLDEALKAKHVVLVSGNCAPSDFGPSWQRAITHDYEVVEFRSG